MLITNNFHRHNSSQSRPVQNCDVSSREAPVDTYSPSSRERIQEVAFMTVLGAAGAVAVPALLTPMGDLGVVAARAVVGGLVGAGLATAFPWD